MGGGPIMEVWGWGWVVGAGITLNSVLFHKHGAFC